MAEKGFRIVINFLVRAVLGLTLIFFINQFLDTNNVESGVGLNPVTFAASGTLGIPGVALLYGISFYQGL